MTEGESVRRPGPSQARLLGLLAALVALQGFFPTPSAAQWPEGHGNWWAKVSAFHHRTTEQFRADGDRRPFLNDDARSVSSAVFLDILVGVTDRLDLWAQVPWFHLRFDDVSDDRTSQGIGDIRLSARHTLVRLAGGAVPISARYTAKVPVVDFPQDAEVIPVGEGQWDHEAWLEAGASFWPAPAYAVLWLGYRWRTLNEDTTRDPGDERLLLAEVGGSVTSSLGGKLVLDGVFGTNGSIQGLRVGSDARRIVYLQPALTWQATSSTALEVGARYPLAGKNFPAGTQWTVGLFHRGGGPR